MDLEGWSFVEVKRHTSGNKTVANSKFLDGVRVCNYRLKLDLMVAKSSSKTMLSLPEVMMMKMMMNCFCCMIGQQKGFSIISSWEHCQRSSPKGISDTLWAGFEPTHNLSLILVEWSYAVLIANKLPNVMIH